MDKDKAVTEVIVAVASAIKELGSVPSGHLYARLMGYMSLESYNNIIEYLKKAQWIEEKNHVITWVGK